MFSLFFCTSYYRAFAPLREKIACEGAKAQMFTYDSNHNFRI